MPKSSHSLTIRSNWAWPLSRACSAIPSTPARRVRPAAGSWAALATKQTSSCWSPRTAPNWSTRLWPGSSEPLGGRDNPISSSVPTSQEVLGSRALRLPRRDLAARRAWHGIEQARRLPDPPPDRPRIRTLGVVRPGRPLVWPGQFVLGYQNRTRWTRCGRCTSGDKGPGMGEERLVHRHPSSNSGCRGILALRAPTAEALRRGVAGHDRRAPGGAAWWAAGRAGRRCPVTRGDDPLWPPTPSPTTTSATPSPPCDADDRRRTATVSRTPRRLRGAALPGRRPHPQGQPPRHRPNRAVRRTRSSVSSFVGASRSANRSRGRASPAGAPAAATPDAERGLMFAAYQTSIDNQFEFLQRTWANTEDNPNVGGTTPSWARTDLAATTATNDPAVRQRAHRSNRQHRTQQTSSPPTGGGYFFAPALSALTGRIGCE